MQKQQQGCKAGINQAPLANDDSAPVPACGRCPVGFAAIVVPAGAAST
jgi:hypothetical protein